MCVYCDESEWPHQANYFCDLMSLNDNLFFEQVKAFQLVHRIVYMNVCFCVGLPSVMNCCKWIWWLESISLKDTLQSTVTRCYALTMQVFHDELCCLQDWWSCVYHLCLLILSHMIHRGISQPTSAPVLSNLDCSSYSNENGFTTYGCSFSTAATCAPGDSAAVECSKSLWSHTCVHTQIHTLTHLVTQSHACV